MKKTLLTSMAVIGLVFTFNSVQAEQTSRDDMMKEIAALQREWAKIKYQMKDEKLQLASIVTLEMQASKVSQKFEAYAEPKIWEGIILSTDAGIVKGLSALSKVKDAKKLFETSLEQNPTALNASAHTSLGSLYYQVPGWPIGFGDDDKAEEHFKTALAHSPDSIDANFFYGEFLMENKRFEEANTHFERALQAKTRPNRPIADAGRRKEIELALVKLSEIGQ